MIRRLNRRLRFRAAVTTALERGFIALDARYLAIGFRHPNAAFHLAAPAACRTNTLHVACRLRLVHAIRKRAAGFRDRTRCSGYRRQFQKRTARHIQHTHCPSFFSSGASLFLEALRCSSRADTSTMGAKARAHIYPSRGNSLASHYPCEGYFLQMPCSAK